MSVTAYRRALEGRLGELPEAVQVLLAPTDYNGAFGEDEPDELYFFARMVVGPANTEVEDRIDELVDRVPKLVANDRQLGGLVSDVAVTRCSGHMPFPNETLGVQWTIRVTR